MGFYSRKDKRIIMLTDLLITNLGYVALRLFVTGNIVLLFQHLFKRVVGEHRSYYTAVFIVAQLSFWYDFIIFKWYFQ